MGYDYHIRRLSYEEEEALEPELSAALEQAFEEERFDEHDALQAQLDQRLLERRARISLDELLAAVDGIDGLRHTEHEAMTGVNPRTGERIIMKLGPGAFEVFIDGKWTYGFGWHKGTLTWRAWHDIGADDPMGCLMSQLARALNARIFGDEGEEYPLV